jgi:hypothetical protein
MENLIGKRFGRLSPMKYAGKNKWGKSLFLCKCNCGKEIIVTENNLKTGNTKSCGCLQKIIVSKTGKSNKLHGHAKNNKISKIYRTWNQIMQRCNNPKNKGYKSYGGRGIKICKRWLKFENFLEDVKGIPKDLTFDRIDNNRGYSPNNWKLSTMKEQNRNKRNNIYITFNNKTQLLLEWAEELDIPYATLYYRIYKLKWAIGRALTTTVRKCIRK